MKYNIVRTTLAIVSMATLYMPPQSASAQNCGAVLTAPLTVLHKNVGPCGPTTPVAITLSNSAGNTPVLDLNGYRIFGMNPPIPGSIGVQLEAFDTVTGGPAISAVYGPGRIDHFDTGIQVLYDYNTVTHVHLVANNTGISSGTGNNSISANTLKRNSCWGMSSATSGSNPADSIVDNFITGSIPSSTSSTCPGIGIAVQDGTYVQGNVVDHCTLGMYSTTTGGVTAFISGNDFSHNSLQGASISNAQGITVSGNYFHNNGQEGLLLNNVLGDQYGLSIQGNFADGNNAKGGLGGIALVNINNLTIQSNVALGNASIPVVDLYWDGTGAGNTWASNVCDTESGSISPPQCW